MNLTKETLETIYLRGENLEKTNEVETILHRCLRSAINGFDFDSFRYDEKNQAEVEKFHLIKEKLEALGYDVYVDGDEGNMYLYVSWF